MKKFLGAAIFCSSFLFTAPIFAAAGDVPALLDVGAVSSCQVNLTWDAVAGVDSYVLEYSDKPVGNPNLSMAVVLGEVANTKTNFYHTQIIPGTEVIYGIRTKTGGVVSVGRTVSSAVTTGTFTDPNPPTSIVGNGLDDGKGAEVTWPSVVFGVNGTDTGYEVERKTYPSGGWAPVSGSPLPFALTFYNDGVPQLDPANAYQYRVRSFQNDLGCLPKEIKKSSWVEALIPTQPQNFSTSYIYDGGTPPIRLTWNDSTAEGSYEVNRVKDSTPLISVTENQNTTSYNEGNPQNGSVYEFSVRACAASSCSAPTATSSVRVARSPLEFIARLVYADDAEAKINLSFLDNLNFSGSNPSYNFKINENNFSPMVSVSPNGRGSEKTLEVREDAQALNSSFTYAVQADYGGPTSDWSEATVKTDVKYRLRGAAWSGYGNPNNLAGLGWLVMNSDGVAHLPPTKKWSVNIHQDGFMSGVAWAEASSTSGYGWLSFNKGDLIDCPDDNKAVNCAAFFNETNGEIRGWARFIGLKGTKYEWISLSNVKISGEARTAFVDKESGLERLWRLVKSPEGNTFLEKISSRIGALFNIAFAAGEVTYGLELNPEKEVVGEVWNPELGWIAFTSTNCGGDEDSNTGKDISRCLVTADTVNTPPVISDVRIEPATLGELIDSDREGSMWCAEQPAYKITWHYFDADGDIQASSTINLLNPNNGNTKIIPTINRLSPIAKVTSTDPDANARYKIIVTEFKPLVDLGFNKSVFAQIQSEDGRRLLSAIDSNSNSLATTTPTADYPLISVTYDPNEMKVNEPVKFSSNITRVSPPFSYDWTFASGTPNKSDKSTTTVVFSDVITDGKAYNLTIKKGDNQCSLWGGNVGGGKDKPPRYLEEN